MDIVCDIQINELIHDRFLCLQVTITIQKFLETVHINNQTILNFVNA